MIYKKKEITVEAMQFIDDAEALSQLSDFMNKQDLVVDYANPDNPVLKIETPDGMETAKVGDYIIKDENGEIYPCDEESFLNTYEPNL